MSHLIDDADIERLAFLAGVPNFDDWVSQSQNVAERIAALLDGDVLQSWNLCLPVWIAQGRVNDLSKGVRVPKYFPTFARNLGERFVDRFWSNYGFLIEIIDNHPLNSIELLCAYDLLETVIAEFGVRRLSIPSEIFAINKALPPVVRREHGLSEEDLPTIGEMLARYYADEIHYSGDE